VLALGDTFDRYSIEELLGEGGMGKVYRAYDPRLHRKVALKVMTRRAETPPASARGPNSSEGAVRMLREARAAAALDHPNCVSIFDVGEVDGTAFIAMELIEGRSLRALIGAPVPWDKRLRWLVDVARALAAAHKRGLVHRDIKPENVMVREDGVVKVLDFGIARRPDAPVDPVGATQQVGLEALTGKGVVIGTPRYMSPEQMRGDPLDGRSDQFAWGVLAYEVLSGKSPWRRDDGSLAALAELLTRDPEPMEIEGLPVIVEQTVRRALAKAHEARFATMEDIVRALEPYASGSVADVSVSSEQPTKPAPTPTGSNETEMSTSTPTPAPEPPAHQAPPAAPPKQRGSWAIAAVALVAAAAAGALAWTRPPPAPPHPPTAAPVAAAAPTAITDLPDPPTSSQEALGAYRAAAQAYRDGVGGVDVMYERATQLDPNLAAAYLRLAHFRFQASPSQGRAAYNRAVGLRSRLSERDQMLLWAFEPFIGDQASDVSERRRRLQRVAEKYPLDAELYYYLGLSTSVKFITQDVDALGKAVELDPAFARAWWQLGQGYAYDGDLPKARQALDKCLDVSHGATCCLWNRICLDESEGACEAVEKDARQWAAVDGRDPLGRFAVAAALYARGRSVESVTEALRQKESVESDAERPRSVLYDEMQLAFLRGDFAEVLRRAHEVEKLTADAQAETDHQPAARAILEALTESGQQGAAATYAAQYMKRREAWLHDPFAEDFALANDLVPPVLRALRAANKISPADFRAQRDAFVTSWLDRLVPHALGYVWMHGRASLVETPEDAREALDAFPTAAVPAYTPKTLAAMWAGKTYLLAGRVDDAIATLQRTASSCLALEFPVLHTQSNLWLGKAREAKHDTAGACQAYAVVLARWGKAIPRSISADEARARRKALGCK
jgi:eukaryotic-like serine/threonine-protein kinase